MKTFFKNTNLFFMLVLIIFLRITPSVFSQEEINLDKEPEEEVDILKDSKEENIVKLIEIKGNKVISTGTILSRIKTAVNQPYQPRIASDDIKRLYNTGFFSDVSINLIEYEGGLKVVFNVVERPIIETITIEGARIIKEAKLRELMLTKTGQYLDFSKLKDDIDTIKKGYEDKGISLTEVDYKLDIDEQLNTASIKITIKEGKKLKVKKILIEGNYNFSDKRIIKLIKSRPAWLFNAGLFKEDVLGDDLERIKVFYNREGFSDAKTESSHYVDSKTKRIIINIKIEEGKRYKIGSVRIKGNKVFTETQIREAIKNIIPENIYSEEAILEDVYGIQTLYLNRGYIFAQVKDITSIDPDSGLVDVSFEIIENEIAYVDKINVRGNIKTKDIVIRRELRIYPGEPFDGDKIRRSRERLNNLGFFEEVNFDTEPGSKPNAKDLVVEVKEAKTGEFSFGGGYSSVEEIVGFVEIAQKNFDWRNWPYFTGDGQDIRVRATIGSLGGEYDLSFTEPWLFDHPISGGFDIYRRFHERESDVGYAFDEERQGGDLRLAKELSEYLKVDLMYRIEEIDIADVDSAATGELKKEEGSNVISSLSAGLTYDRRDNIFNPAKGFVLGGNITLAGGLLGADKDFTKFYGRASKYFSLWNKSVLELKMRVGLADAFSNTDDVPVYERFYAGGAYTIRGYDERSIGPIDSATEDPIGGNAMLIGNIEYLYPFMEFIKGAVFFDTGNVWRELEDFASGDFNSGVGLGVRVKTPIGPIKLDYGFPLDLAPGEEDKEGKFHFSFSRGF